MELVVHPHETVDFDTFKGFAGPAIALDGYVPGPTRFDRAHVSFNHHEGVDRFCTRATCEQVALAIRSRGALVLNPDDKLSVHVNDPDPDVALSTWLLNNPQRIHETAVEHLVALEGAIDTTGGCCAEADDLDELAWVIEPWAVSRGSLASATAQDMTDIIDEVCERIDAHVAGKGSRVDATDSYDVLRAVGPVWAVVEHHPLARARLCADGAAGFVAVRPGAAASGTLAVTLGKASPFISLDLDRCYAQLNELEGCTGHEIWGGSDLVGGSPRSLGTRLDVRDILDVTSGNFAA